MINMKKAICICISALIIFLGMSTIQAAPVEEFNPSQQQEVAKSSKVSCGNVTGIPRKIPELTRDIVLILEIAVPVLLVAFGSFDLVKGVAAGKDDEIKKAQSIFIKRMITAGIAFFVIVGVKFLISVVDNASSSSNIANCIDCFIVDEKYCK